MSIQEIRVQYLKAEAFIGDQCRLISAEVGNSKAINALSGGGFLGDDDDVLPGSCSTDGKRSSLQNLRE